LECPIGSNAHGFLPAYDYAVRKPLLPLVFATMTMLRLRKISGAVLLLLCLHGAHAQEKIQGKVLRYTFPVAETGFDPAQISDLYSRVAAANMFEALYAFGYLSRPAKVVPVVAEALPVIADSYRTFTIKIKPGIHFVDDPAFCDQAGSRCKKREVTAQDFVYSYKRHFDPGYNSYAYDSLRESQLVGMDALRKAAEKPGGKFDYDKEVEGVRALDRYTIQFKLAESRPRFIYQMTDPALVGAVAREVVEKYGDKIMEHPVGTGPFKLHEWVRSSKMVFVRNPNYRQVRYENAVHPAPDDAQAQALLKRFKGRQLPMIGRVEVSIIEENQPRWLSFLGADHDLLERLPNTFANQAIPNNKLAPFLERKGIAMERTAAADMTLTYFNMEDPIVGGYKPANVALRRAIALAYNTEEEIRRPRRNQSIPAQGPIQPGRFGYDNTFKTEMSDYNPARAMALLDMFGYKDKNRDGWRDMPDGSPLILQYATQPEQSSRELNEIWRKYMNAVGIKIDFDTGKWPEQLKSARAGKLMMWGLGLSATDPDPTDALGIAYGPSKGEGNLSRYRNAAFDQLYTKQLLMPDGPERKAAVQRLVKIMVADMPYKVSTHRILTDMAHPWLIGYRREQFARDFWQYVDIDVAQQAQHLYH
jgi:ABC-type transport system substrate-binding protein